MQVPCLKRAEDRYLYYTKEMRTSLSENGNDLSQSCLKCGALRSREDSRTRNQIL